MQESINTTVDTDNTLRVSGRSLYAFMNAGDTQSFSSFMRHRMGMLKLEEGKDYLELPKWRQTDTSRLMLEFQFTLDAAIALAEYSRSARAVNYLQAVKASQEATVGNTPLATFTPVFEPNAVSADGPLVGPGSVIEVPNPKPLTLLQKALLEAASLAEQPEVDEGLKDRLETVENKLDIILKLFRSAAEGLFGPMVPVEVEEDIDLVPTQIMLRVDNPRGQIIGLVNDYVAVNPSVTHQQVWRKLYSLLNDQYGINAHRHKLPKESYLEGIEKLGQLNNMLRVAVSALVDHPAPTPTRLKSTAILTAAATTEEAHS